MVGTFLMMTEEIVGEIPLAWIGPIILVIVNVLLLLFFCQRGWIITNFDYKTREAIETERNIIRSQIAYVRSHYERLINTQKIPAGFAREKGKYAVERLIVQWIEWIISDNINNKPLYVHMKEDMVVHIIMVYTNLARADAPELDIHVTKEHEERIRADTRNVIVKLIEIRESFAT